MFKRKKRNNEFDSYEDDIMNLVTKEEEIMSSYDENYQKNDEYEYEYEDEYEEDFNKEITEEIQEQEPVIETYEDHGMAMAFSLVGLRVAGIEILNPMCCRKTFEEYFDVLETLTRGK